MGMPDVGGDARKLGVRLDVDIPVDASGMVESGHGGMSVSPDEAGNLPAHRRPSELGGSGKDPVFEIAEEDLPDTLLMGEETERMDDDMVRQEFEMALRSPEPTMQLRSVTQTLLQGGWEHDRLLKLLEGYRDEMRVLGRDDDEDVVLEVMDFVAGWASPHMKL
jgi:hypothetical protein